MKRFEARYLITNGTTIMNNVTGSDNERGATDDLRGSENTQSEVQDGLTTYKEDSVAMAELPRPTFSTVWNGSILNEDQYLGRILSRSYPIKSFTWASTDVFGDILASIKLPYDLFQMPMIAQQLNFFEFFRAKGVKLTVRMNSTVQHYGALAFSHVPIASTATAEYQDVDGFQVLNNDPHIISAMSQDVVELTIPWRIPIPFIRLPMGSFHQSAIARSKVSVLFPLLADADSISSVTVTVFASFIEPEVHGPRPSTFTVMETIEKAPKISVGALEKFKNKVFPSRKLDQSGKRTDPEAKAKTEGGVLADVKSAFSGVEEVVQLGTQLARLIGPFLADKPTSAEGPHAMQPVFGRDMPSGSGMAGGVKLAYDPAAQLSGRSSEIVDHPGTNSIYEIMSIPGFCKQGEFYGTDGVGDLVANWPIHPLYSFTRTTGGTQSYLYPTYLAWYSGLFDFYRGSIRYHLRFCTSRFTSARVRICWIPTNIAAAPIALADNEAGDLLSKVIDINGDTTVDFVVPYANGTFYAQQNATFDPSSPLTTGLGHIAIYMVNEIVNADPDVVPTVYWAMWQSAGPDFKVSCFRGPGEVAVANTNLVTATTAALIVPEPGRKKDQSCVWASATETAESFSGVSGFTESGFIVPEEYGDIESLGKRFDTHPDVGAADVSTTWIPDDPTDPTLVGLQMWLALPFRIARGGSRFKLYPDTASGFLTANQGEYTRGCAIVNTPGALSHVLEFEVPYYSRSPAVCVTSSSVATKSWAQGVTFTAKGASGHLYYAYGDDFSLALPYSPPVIHHSAV